MYIGIDGCRSGWLGVVMDARKEIEIVLFSELKALIDAYSNAKSICIDMPMGLLEDSQQQRKCDPLIRQYLGFPRSSSVFPIPCRQSVYAGSYAEANRINKEILGKGLSKQSWNICGKIKELDVLLANDKELIPIMKESHPEVCFKHLNSKNLQYNKREADGIEERLAIIEKHIPFRQHLNEFLSKHPIRSVAADDVTDAAILCFNAYLGSMNGAVTFPAQVESDVRGIPMKVYLAKV